MNCPPPTLADGPPVLARRCCAWLLAALLGFVALTAQAEPLAVREHHRWTTADDNGPNQVGALAQTADGYLWLGSDDGLLRFDGFNFVRYRPGDEQPLGTVASLLAVDDALWVGLRAGGARLVAGQASRYFAPGDGLPTGALYGFAREASGTLWAAAHDGLARFDGQRWQRVGEAEGFTANSARAVFIDRDGGVWTASSERLYHRPAGVQHFTEVAGELDWASQIAQAADGTLWVAERYVNKLHHVVQGPAPHLQSQELDSPINGLLFDHSGGLWASTPGNGLRRYPAANATLHKADAEQLTSAQGLSADYLWPLLEDRDGTVWAGSSGGLDRFRLGELSAAPLPAGTLNAALAVATDGALWAASNNQGLMRLQGNDLQRWPIPEPVTSLIAAADGTVWIGGPHGVWRGTPAGIVLQAKLPEQAPADASIRAMAVGTDGSLWVSINRLGLFVLHGTNWQPVAGPSEAPSQLMPVSAGTDDQGRLWFGYRDNLLVTRQGDQVCQWGAADGLTIGHITAQLHHGGISWVGGQHGLARFDGQRFQTLHLPDNGQFENIYAILPGTAGDLWVHGKAGIVQLPAAELQRALAEPQHRLRYRSIGLDGSLANDPYRVLPLPTALAGPDGRLWFSTSAGVSWIDPARQLPAPPLPPVVIEALQVDGAPMPLQTALQLAADTQRIVIDYTALNLRAPHSLSFRYRLRGYDRDWIEAGRQRRATYTGLPAGDFRFEVQAFDQGGGEPAAPTVLAFSVEPVFYLRPLFYLPLATTLLLGLWWLHRLVVHRDRRRLQLRLQAQQSERERIARELHDTLLQGLQGLMLRFQAATDTLTVDHPARPRLEHALDRADEVMHEGRERVQELRQPSPGIDLPAALERLGATLDEPGITFTVQVKGHRRALQAAVHDEAYRIAAEAIGNALRHGAARRIEIGLVYGARCFQLHIDDDGQGIPASYAAAQGRPGRWGIRGMHERASGIGARLEVRPLPATGTRVQLELSARLAYPGPTRSVWRRWLTARPRTEDDA
ncbi:histidine kinase [Pseudomonas sp. MM211]|uniref:sensor histidine kinase n=1 Tax=Pseudomonas sp. MM211 TaxID=2866808 RepID=UPI001CED4AF6|nr:sensor histidine kinase [Pseudomonas sp. MM211]UCJ18596.1 histidine kinase [Pseudomonas sp. MM211]